MKARMVSRSSATLVKTPRRSARRSNWPNHVSTALSHDALVGVKCRWKRGWAAKKVPDLEGLESMRFQVRGLPDLAHLPRGQLGVARHQPGAPMGRLAGYPFRGQKQDALDGLPVEDGRSSRPRTIRQPVEALGAIAAVPEVHGRAADMEDPRGFGGALAGIQGEKDACATGLAARRGRPSQPTLQGVTVGWAQAEVHGRLHAGNSTRTSPIRTNYFMYGTLEDDVRHRWEETDRRRHCAPTSRSTSPKSPIHIPGIGDPLQRNTQRRWWAAVLLPRGAVFSASNPPNMGGDKGDMDALRCRRRLAPHRPHGGLHPVGDGHAVPISRPSP